VGLCLGYGDILVQVAQGASAALSLLDCIVFPLDHFGFDAIRFEVDIVRAKTGARKAETELDPYNLMCALMSCLSFLSGSITDPSRDLERAAWWFETSRVC
jgi:hypothetical protein